MAVLERDRLWSLWALTDGRWSLLDSSADRNALDRQARSLQAVFATKIFMVVQGTQSPGRL